MQTNTHPHALTPEQARSYLSKRTQEEAENLENMLHEKRKITSLYV